MELKGIGKGGREGQVVELPNLMALTIVLVVMLAIAFVISIYASFGTSKTLIMTSNRIPILHKESYRLHRFFNQPRDSQHTFYVKCRSENDESNSDSAKLSFRINTSLALEMNEKNREPELRFISLRPSIGRIRPQETTGLLQGFASNVLGANFNEIKKERDPDSIVDFQAITNRPASCQVELAVCRKDNIAKGCVGETEDATHRLWGLGQVKLGHIESLKKTANYEEIRQKAVSSYKQAEEGLGTEGDRRMMAMADSFDQVNTLLFSQRPQHLKAAKDHLSINEVEVDFEQLFYKLLRQEELGEEFWAAFLRKDDYYGYEAGGSGKIHTQDKQPKELPLSVIEDDMTWFYRFNCSQGEQTVTSPWGVIDLGEEPTKKEQGKGLVIEQVEFVSDFKRSQGVLNSYTPQLKVVTNRSAVCRGGFYPASYREHSFTMDTIGGRLHLRNVSFNDRYLNQYDLETTDLVREWLYCRQEGYNCSLINPEQAIHQVKGEVFTSVGVNPESYYEISLYNSSGGLIKPLHFTAAKERPLAEVNTFSTPLSLVNGTGKLVYEVSSGRQLKPPD